MNESFLPLACIYIKNNPSIARTVAKRPNAKVKRLSICMLILCGSRAFWRLVCVAREVKTTLPWYGRVSAGKE